PQLTEPRLSASPGAAEGPGRWALHRADAVVWVNLSADPWSVPAEERMVWLATKDAVVCADEFVIAPDSAVVAGPVHMVR
ncbi:MAG: malto-oligosyltrehalose trehalohydrolase, partial [Microbacterium sp.]